MILVVEIYGKHANGEGGVGAESARVFDPLLWMRNYLQITCGKATRFSKS